MIEQTVDSALSIATDPPLAVINPAAKSALLIRDEALLTSKIMIVDDEPINLMVARKYLSLEGYTNFVTTTEPRQAVEMVIQERPDVLLLDIMMPHVSGLDILAELRADQRWTHLPVLILTAAADQATKRRALELGASDFLTKPVEPTELAPRIHNVLMVKRHHDYLNEYSHQLEAEVLGRTAELAPLAAGSDLLSGPRRRIPR